MVGLSKKGREEYLQVLLKEREKAEEEIKEMSKREDSIGVRQFDRHENEFLAQESQRKQALYNQQFEHLRKINLRIDAVKKGIFKGICPDCKKSIKKEDLFQFPMRERCINCQLEQNNHRR